MGGSPSRLNLGLIGIDIVFVEDPEHIRAVAADENLERMNAVPNDEKPWWTTWFFTSTKFFDHKRGTWFLPLESNKNPEFAPRLAYLQEKVAEGFSPEDVKAAADAVVAGDDTATAQVMADIVNKRFLEGNPVPPDICEASRKGLNGLGDAIQPWQYFPAKSGMETVDAFAVEKCPILHAKDVSHNIGAGTQSMLTAGKTLLAAVGSGKTVKEIFAAEAITIQVPRICVAPTTVGGLLGSDAVPKKTVFLLKIKDAAAVTGDFNFVFAAGTADRHCAFEPFFVPFMEALQKELENRAAKKVLLLDEEKSSDSLKKEL